MNPPYGKNIKTWIKKAYDECKEHNVTTVCLIPSRTDTKYWHDYCMNAAEIRLLQGRLKFGDATNSAPFPSAVVVFKPTDEPLKVTSMQSVNPVPLFTFDRK